MNRLDIIEAHYAFCCDWYDGQTDPLYARMCRIRQYYKPGIMFNGYESLSDDAKMIYQQLVAGTYRHFKKAVDPKVQCIQ